VLRFVRETWCSGIADGVVVVPLALEAEILRIAFDQVNGEHHAGAPPGAYLRDVYTKYGVL
jgi:hypothetical protein